MLSELCLRYVEVVNNGGLPKIENVWKYISKKEIDDYLEREFKQQLRIGNGSVGQDGGYRMMVVVKNLVDGERRKWGEKIIGNYCRKVKSMEAGVEEGHVRRLMEGIVEGGKRMEDENKKKWKVKK